jgi:hypothetical protein
MLVLMYLQVIIQLVLLVILRLKVTVKLSQTVNGFAQMMRANTLLLQLIVMQQIHGLLLYNNVKRDRVFVVIGLILVHVSFELSLC